MNRSRYVPFERNRYFYGKLLTVRDFMTEQTYNADKRRLVNRLLYGSGVVSGLQVIAVDDKSISVETGVALDSMGREIVVASPVTVKLSNIDGFVNYDYAKNVYLCLVYDEKAKEPVHAVGGSNSNEEVNEYNRIQESYKLFITDKRPKYNAQRYEYFIYDEWTWYEDEHVTITQQAPRYIEKGIPFNITLKIEKTLQSPSISFEYIPEFEGVNIIEGLTDGKVVFQEPTDSGETSFEKVITLLWKTDEEIEPETAVYKLGAKSSSGKLVIGERIVYDVSYLKQKIELINTSLDEKVLQSYYNRSLDQALESQAEAAIYVAQLNLLQLGSSYVIDKVIPQPFDDYIINPTLLYKLMQASSLKADVNEDSTNIQIGVPTQLVVEPVPSIVDEFARILPTEPEEAPPVAVSGEFEVNIVAPPKLKWYHSKQKVFFSEEIAHTFKHHAPIITLALSDEEQQSDVVVPQLYKKSNTIIVGDASLFKGSDYEVEYPPITWSIIQNPAKGTFVVAVKVHKKTDRLRLKFKWWAVQAVDLLAEAEEASNQIGSFSYAQAAASQSK